MTTGKRKPGTLGGTLDEIKEGTFITNALGRSARRKSPWNLLLLLIFPLWLALWWGAVDLVWIAHASFFNGHDVTISMNWMKGMGSGPLSAAGFLMIFAPLLPTLSGAMVIGNFLIYLIPAARRAMDAEDRAFPGTEYATAQSALTRLTVISLPIALILSLLGARFL